VVGNQGKISMKLLYISNARIPTEKAHGYQICKMCEQFASAGIQVELWLPTRGDWRQDLFKHYSLTENFKVRYIKSPDMLKYERYIGRGGIYLTQIFYLINILFRRISKDTIIYSRNPELAGVCSWRGFKTVYEAHSWPASKLGLHKFLLKNSRIVTINNYLRNKFIGNGFDKDKIIVEHDGVDLEHYKNEINRENVRKELGLPLDKKTGCIYRPSL
jgi:hypothetical protein